jgi:hypothetical protein
MDANKAEAERRVRQACRLIESAYRLADLIPRDTVEHVKTAMIVGAERAAEDVREDVSKL